MLSALTKPGANVPWLETIWPALKHARADFTKASAKIDRLKREIQADRLAANRDESYGRSAEQVAHTKGLHAALEEAKAERAAADNKVRQERKAAQERALAAIADDHDLLTARTLLLQIEAAGDAIAAASELEALRDEARKKKLPQVPVSHHTIAVWAHLKEAAVNLIERGIIKPTDLPPAVKTAWRK